ncbi:MULTISPECIES: hypothetical protein [Thermomonosporaceae]|uniref:hypothetical protein n=1 Tax=Thermomonosporaceae TaxID=2012 RepID=UPI00255ACDE1|nr:MULTISPECIES: hypothetical protein [Thermomonosporaceae]MDL4771386.1 hypothetical protein [Actinomadura xylanilytica]
MPRTVRYVAFAACAALGVAGPALTDCGGAPPRTGAGSAVLAAAVLTGRDVPPEFLPAEDQHPFDGLRPDDPYCARLLRITGAIRARDFGGDGGSPEAHAAFYRLEPEATLVQHVFRLPSGKAAAAVDRGRRAVAGCPRLTFTFGYRGIGMRRALLRRPAAVPDAFAVRYWSGPGPQPVALDMIMARTADDLLVLAAPGALGAGGAHGFEGIAAKAIAKLAALRGTTPPQAGAP